MPVVHVLDERLPCGVLPRPAALCLNRQRTFQHVDKEGVPIYSFLMQEAPGSSVSARVQIWLSLVWTSMPIWSMVRLSSCGVDGVCALVGHKICDHVEREASGFIPSTLKL
jgi:hypothetical protein